MCLYAALFGKEHSGLAVCLQLRESGRYITVWETNSHAFFPCSSTDLLNTQKTRLVDARLGSSSLYFVGKTTDCEGYQL